MTENNRRKVSSLLHRLANGIAKGECQCEDFICDVLKDIMQDDYTRTEAARYLHISERTFDRYRRDGLIGEGRKKPGGLTTWKRSQLDRLVQDRKIQGGGGRLNVYSCGHCDTFSCPLKELMSLFRACS